MATIPVNLGVKYADKTLKKYYGKAVTPEITNQEYEPLLSSGGADRVKILSFLNSPSLSDYTKGSDMSAESWMGDTEDTLSLDQKKYYNFEIDSLDKFEAYVNDLEENLRYDVSGVLQQTIDSYVLGTFLRDAKVGHRIGSDNWRGSVKISAAGACTASQESSYVGPFLAADATYYAGISFDGGVTWYRISAFTASNSVTVTDWNGSTYSGGALYEKAARIEAANPKALTSTTIYAEITNLGAALTKDYIPLDNRWLVVHPTVGAVLRRATELIPAVPAAYSGVVENGLLGYISGFKVYESPLVRGDNTSGFFCPAGHKSWITFAHAFKESRVQPDPDRFATMYQGLNVYSGVVPAIRRKSGAYLFCTVS